MCVTKNSHVRQYSRQNTVKEGVLYRKGYCTVRLKGGRRAPSLRHYCTGWGTVQSGRREGGGHFPSGSTVDRRKGRRALYRTGYCTGKGTVQSGSREGGGHFPSGTTVQEGTVQEGNVQEEGTAQ